MFGDRLFGWCSCRFKSLLAHFGLTSEDGLLSFSKVVTLLVVFLPMSNVKSALVIASAHGTKILLALIEKTNLDVKANDSDQRKTISITEHLRAIDAVAAKSFVDPNDDTSAAGPDVGAQ